MLVALAKHLGVAERAAISNRWAFGPLLPSRMGSTPADIIKSVDNGI